MKLIFKLLFGLALLTSCTKNEDLGTEGVIRLGVKPDAYTRGSVNDVAGLAKVGNQIGVYGVNYGDLGSETPSKIKWGTYIIENQRTTKIDDASGAISFETKYTYPEKTWVKFFAYYPYAEVGTADSSRDYLEVATADRAPLLHLTIDGSVDVMYATPIFGSIDDKASKVLDFNHALTQLRFKIKDAVGVLKDTKIKKINFNGVNTTSIMNIETGKFEEWGTPSNDIELNATYPFAVTDTEVNVDGSVMLQPGLATFTLSIATENGLIYTDVKVKPNNTATFEAGTSYLVTLSILDKQEVKSTATIQPWIMAGFSDNIVQ